MCAVTDLPADLPRDPNPRAQNIDRGIWREIKKHLLNEEGTANTFHLKNKGITIIAERVEKRSDDEYELVIGPGPSISRTTRASIRSAHTCRRRRCWRTI